LHLDYQPNHLVFLFGQNSANKSQLFNILGIDSFLSKFIRGMNKAIKYLKVSMFYIDKEFTLGQRNFTNGQDGQREFGMEMR
jgi:hypothetical protein